MSKHIADISIKIGADSYELTQVMQSTKKQMGSMSKSIDRLGKNLSLKLTAPLVALGAVSLSLADTQAKAEAKVQQAIKSTGGAAKLNFDQLKRFASELQGKTIFGDEKILNDSTAQLLTFTNIAGENFKRTQAVALDLSTVLDGDLKSASIQLGKALNDPVKNLSALSRSGIQFSKEQTAMIKTLVESNRLFEAQGVILTEIEKQYGGQAEAVAKVGLGALKQLKNSWGDFMEQIGAVMTPFINKIAVSLSKVVAVMQNMDPVLLKVIVGISAAAAAVGPLLIALGSLVKLASLSNVALGAIKVSLLALASPVGAVVTAITALGAALAYVYYQKKKLNEELENEEFESLSKLPTETLQSELARNQEWQERRRAINSSAFLRNIPDEEDDGLMELIREEKLYLKVLSERKKQEEEQARFAQEQTKILEQITNSLNKEIAKTPGLINDITSKIEDLEKKKLLPESSLEDIARYNDEIKVLKDNLSYIQNITSQQLTYKQTTATPDNIKSITPSFDIQLPDISGAFNKIDEQTGLMKERMKENLDGLNESIGASIQQLLGNTITAVAETIGGIMSGDLGFDDLLKTILSQMAGFLIEIGKQLIQFGVKMEAFKVAINFGIENPFLAIAAGVAMVALGSFMKNKIQKNAKDKLPKLAKGGLAYGETYAMVGDNPNASVDPEVIAPLSKLKNIIGDTGSRNMQISLNGQLVAKGRDLVYVLGKENFKLGIIGG